MNSVIVDVDALNDLIKLIDKYITDLKEAQKQTLSKVDSIGDEWNDLDFNIFRSTVDAVEFVLNDYIEKLNEVKSNIYRNIEKIKELNNIQTQ